MPKFKCDILSNFQTMCKHNIFEIFRVFHFSKKVVDKFIRAVLLCGCGGWTNSWTWWGDFFFKGGNPPACIWNVHLTTVTFLQAGTSGKNNAKQRTRAAKNFIVNIVLDHTALKYSSFSIYRTYTCTHGTKKLFLTVRDSLARSYKFVWRIGILLLKVDSSLKTRFF